MRKKRKEEKVGPHDFVTIQAFVMYAVAYVMLGAIIVLWHRAKIPAEKRPPRYRTVFRGALWPFTSLRWGWKKGMRKIELEEMFKWTE